MSKIMLPNGMVAYSMGSPEEAAREQRMIDQRHYVTRVICEEKGWPQEPTELTIEQILEIREDPRWKNAGGDQ